MTANTMKKTTDKLEKDVGQVVELNAEARAAAKKMLAEFTKLVQLAQKTGLVTTDSKKLLQKTTDVISGAYDRSYTALNQQNEILRQIRLGNSKAVDAPAPSTAARSNRR